MAKKMQLGATPGKLAIIAILAVVFAIVMVLQFGGSSSQSTVPVVPRAPRAQRTAGATHETLASTSVTSNSDPQRPIVKHVAFESKPLPQFSREAAASYDPFSRPEHLRISASEAPSRTDVDSQRAEQAERERALAEVRKFEVAAIFQSGTDQVAVIDNQMIRVGDLFQGFRVTDIQADGIKLEEQHSNGR